MAYTYKLFDGAGVEIDQGDVENRAAWYGHGDSAEAAFVEKYGVQLKISMNPEKLRNKAAPDLVFDGRLADLKHQATPLFTAQRHYKIDPTYAVTFNLKDALAYGGWGQKYEGFTIFYWVDWVAQRMDMGGKSYKAQPLQGLWKMPFAELENMRKTAPIHWYFKRWKVVEDNPEVAAKLREFEPRLAEGGSVFSIRGKGGNAACSYVFDLSKFEKVA